MITCKSCISLFVVAFVCLSHAAHAESEAFVVSGGDRSCPADHRLLASSYAKRNNAQVCASLEDWEIARLAGNSSISGAANNCVINEVDHRILRKSLCVPLTDNGLARSILLKGKFRSQSQLSAMAPVEWRQVLVTELANRTASPSETYDQLGNEALAGIGSLIVYLLQIQNTNPSELAKMSIVDIRRAIQQELTSLTGNSAEEMLNMSDLELADLLYQG